MVQDRIGEMGKSSQDFVPHHVHLTQELCAPFWGYLNHVLHITKSRVEMGVGGIDALVDHMHVSYEIERKEIKVRTHE
jgi:hypothetical protein